jgi:hypothetical protein
MLNTYDLFITRVIHGKLPIQIDLHKKIKSFVDNNYSEENKVSCVNGFQFHGDFDGKKELNNNLNNYLNNFMNMKIDHGWLNVLGNSSYNFPHSHRGNNISHSGVFYLSYENNNIHFAKDSKYFEIKPKLFDFLIFPYDLLHYVLPENRPEKRICYAFNLTEIKE